jgi:excisionase family DNA binding protein
MSPKKKSMNTSSSPTKQRVSPNAGKKIEPESGYFTVDEVAGRLRCSYSSVVRMIEAGLLPGTVNISASLRNKRYRIPVATLTKFEAKRAIGNN